MSDKVITCKVLPPTDRTISGTNMSDKVITHKVLNDKVLPPTDRAISRTDMGNKVLLPLLHTRDRVLLLLIVLRQSAAAMDRSISGTDMSG